MAKFCTVLIVDDSADDRKIYRRYLAKDPHESYEVLEADSGEAGLALCQERSCDVLLLDCYLPDMDGLEFLRCLKLQQPDRGVPVIMMTGQSDTAIAVQAMKWGVVDYLDKQHLTQNVLQLLLRNTFQKLDLSTRLAQTQERQQLIATTALRIRESLCLQGILQTAVDELQQLLKCDRVVVYQCTPTQHNPILAQSRETSATGERVRHLDWDENVTLVCGAGELPNEDHGNTTRDPIVPITLTQNSQASSKPWGMLIAHHHDQKQLWSTDEISFLQEISVHMAIAIQQAELFAQTQAALEKEQELNVFKSKFINTISHEYRTPLASIQGAAATLKQHSQQLAQARQQRLLQIIEEKAKYMTKLVSDLLIVNQIELNKARFQPVPLNLPLFFSELIEEQRILLGDRFDITFQHTGDAKDFCGDRGLLRLVFDNLFSNAVKYSPNGGRIEFQLLAHPADITLSIGDQGIGILKEEQQNLFQSFSRGSNVDTIPGTGLGLAIVKACVDLHQGHVDLQSSPTTGTKVTVCLPNHIGSNFRPDLLESPEILSNSGEG
jgi:signal transduction histidine kinase/FixJ family two-component response regulator